MARELLREVRGLIDGVYIMPSFGRYEITVEVMAAVAATCFIGVVTWMEEGAAQSGAWSVLAGAVS